jgi:hypothetical protein
MNAADILERADGRTAALPGSPGTGPAPGRARKLDKALADPLTWNTVDAAVQWAGDSPAWPYAVLLGPETVTVQLAGRIPAEPPRPWTAVAGGWTVGRAALAKAELPEQQTRAYSSSAYVALGSRGPDIAFLDLGLAPGVLTVDGDRPAATELVNSMMTQVLAGGLHRVRTDLNELLEDRAAGGGTALTFLVCADPDTETAVRLHKAASLWPWLRVVVRGDTQGTRWSLTVDGDGVLRAPALGLSTVCSGLPQSIPRRPAARPAAPAIQPEPEPVPSALPEVPFSLDEHPGLQPLPPRDPALSPDVFTPAPVHHHHHEPTGARG